MNTRPTVPALVVISALIAVVLIGAFLPRYPETAGMICAGLALVVGALLLAGGGPK